MTVKITKPEINIREKINELDKPSGIAGEAMLRAETPQEQFDLVGAGRKNLIVNGSMSVAQRGTSFTSHSGYCIDRYYGFGHTYAQIDNGDFYSLRMTYVSGTDAQIYHPVELQEGQLENDQTYTLSFKYKSSGLPLSLEIFYREGVTGSNVVAQTSGTILNNADTFTDFSITFTCKGRLSSHTALNIRFGQFGGVSEVANLQLEAGKIATPFETRLPGEELHLCQRYLYYVGLQGVNYKYMPCAGTIYTPSNAYTMWKYPRTMRAVPALNYSSATDFQTVSGGSVRNTTAITYSGSSFTDSAVVIFVASGADQGHGVLIRSDENTDVFISFDAEFQ